MESENRDFFMRTLWTELEKEIPKDTGIHQRTYRRLDLDKETGIRLGCTVPGNTWEMLIEIGKPGDVILINFPKWNGMNFEIMTMDIPKQGTIHIRLFLVQYQSRDVFITVCSDLIKSLDGCLINESRRNIIIDFLAKWDLFFKKYGQEGLSLEAQLGLFGELWWIKQMIQGGVQPMIAVDSWMGCRRSYHDFEINGNVVEVKTTMTKEPRRVQINNERQLDNRGLQSLNMFALTLTKSASGGETLPDLIKDLRNIFFRKPVAYVFDNSLNEAGYLDIHDHMYGNISYTVLKEELFHVTEGFPRIIDVPPGLGDIRYSLVLSSCSGFICDKGDYLKRITGTI